MIWCWSSNLDGDPTFCWSFPVLFCHFIDEIKIVCFSLQSAILCFYIQYYGRWSINLRPCSRARKAHPLSLQNRSRMMKMNTSHPHPLDTWLMKSNPLQRWTVRLNIAHLISNHSILTKQIILNFEATTVGKSHSLRNIFNHIRESHQAALIDTCVTPDNILFFLPDYAPNNIATQNGIVTAAQGRTVIAQQDYVGNNKYGPKRRRLETTVQGRCWWRLRWFLGRGKKLLGQRIPKHTLRASQTCSKNCPYFWLRCLTIFESSKLKS